MPKLHRHLAILHACARQARGFNELRSELDNVASTTLARCLRTLRDEGLIRLSEQRLYEPAPGAIALARRLLGRQQVNADLQAAVDALAQETGTSAAYFANEADRIVLLAKREVDGGFHYVDINADRPVLLTAFGLIIVSALPDAERAAILARHLRT
ncbi:MAG: hypothetical protein AAB263_08390, partial [Planctomycetota bacterium]